MDRLVVLNDSPQAAGGATGLAIASATGARRQGIPTTYITSGGGEPSADLIAAGVDVVRVAGDIISPNSRLLGMVHGLYRQSVVRSVDAWIARHDTPRTVYHVHNWSKFLSPGVFRALRPVSKRLVLTAHDFFLTCPNGAQFSFTESAVCSRRANSVACLSHACDRRSYADKLWRSLRHAVREQLLSLVDADVRVVALHDGMVPSLILGGVPEEKIQVIRNPIRPFLDSRVQVENNREILYIGRLSSEKGPDLAARAAQRAGRPIRLIGAGPLADTLHELAPDAMLDGWKTHAEIADRCRSARMLVLPSRWAEPYGLVLGEALWSGLPVIVSDTALLANEVVEAGAGLAVKVTDLDAFAHAMRVISDDDELAATMSKRAFESTRRLGNTFPAWEAEHLRLYRKRLEAV